MRKKRKLVHAVVAGGLGLSLAVTGITQAPVVSYAAEAKKATIGEEEAAALAQKWVEIPEGYTRERAYLETMTPNYMGTSNPFWSFSWQNKAGRHIGVVIDAKTGTLLSYSHYGERTKTPLPSAKPVSEEEGEKLATRFLERVTSETERQSLSKPNQFQGKELMGYLAEQPLSYQYTRLVNGVPFLENGFVIHLNEDGSIQQFERRWFDGDLPESKGIEEVTTELETVLAPSLAYLNLNTWAGHYEEPKRNYALVYRYGDHDPAMIDAVTGKALDRYGKPVEKQKAIKALGPDDGKEPVYSNQVITRDEAAKIAQDVVKRFPQAYRFTGNNGSGASRGPDGIVRQSWHFDFTPDKGTADNENENIQIDIDDRGRISGFSTNEERFGNSRPIEKAVAWSKAQEQAIAIVKILYPDLLDEMYVSSTEPSQEELKQRLKDGQEFDIQFGRLKNGIPIEEWLLYVSVNPETGKVVRVHNREDNIDSTILPTAKSVIDTKEAVSEELAHKEPMLTYFLPMDYRFGQEQSEPKLVYRLVGEDGLVDAGSGKWIGLADVKKQMDASDVEGHPQEQLLKKAIQEKWLFAKDGKVEPDQPMSRVDFLRAVVRFIDRSPLDRRGFRFGNEEEAKPVPASWAKVGEDSAAYDVIVQAVRVGFISTDKPFEPQQAITRGEAATILMRLLGYDRLREKPELFQTPFADVEKPLVPAVAITHGLGLIPEKNGKAFAPQQPMTRAEAAALFQALSELLP